MVFLRTLGTAQIDAGDLRVTPSSARKFALLLRLAAEPGRRLSRTALQEWVFPDVPSRNARHSLRELIYQFRQAGVRIESDITSIELVPKETASDWEDIVRAERPTIDQMAAVEGGFLPAYAPEQSEAFGEWLASYRARSTFELCRALIKEVARARSVGNWSLTERAARACLALDPLNEEATLAQAELLAMQGSKARAVSLLEQYSRDVSDKRTDLSLPATVVRRRITERIADTYRAPLTLPFLGRDGEMASLRERFELARRGQSQCIALVGDAGIGKTRLADEFCVQTTLGGGRVERVVTQPHDIHRPMGTFADLVPRLLQLPGALGCSPESMAALRRLTATVASEEGSLEITGPSEVVATSISRAIADLVDAIGAESPLVVVVDDVQWADELSRQALGSLVASKSRRRLLVVVTSRDRGIVKFFAHRSERLLAIPVVPLSREVAAEVTAQALETHNPAADPELRTWIAGASGGNPFFLRSLIGHYQATGERFVVPSTISSLLDQQIAVVGPDALALLGMSVTLGRHTDIDRLGLALELPYFRLQAALRELEMSHLVLQDGQHIGPAHWLIAEAVTRATPPISLRLYHRRAATVLERESEGGVSSALWDCAEHWIAAGEKDHATRVLRACATRSIEIGRPREAAEVLLRAAALIDGAARCELVSAAVEIADAANEVDVFMRGVALSEQLGVQIKYEGFELGNALARIKSFHVANDLYDVLRSWLAPDRPMRIRVKAGLSVLITAHRQSDQSIADEAFRALFPNGVNADAIDDIDVMIVALVYHSQFGDLPTSVLLAQRLLSRADNETPVVAADLRRKAAIALWHAGYVEDALNAFELAYATAARCGMRSTQCSIAGMLTTISFDAQDDARSARWLNELEDVMLEVPEFMASMHYIILRGDLACARGDRQELRFWLYRALSSVPESPTVEAQRWIRIFSARLNQLSNSPCDPDLIVSELIGHHRPGQVVGDIGDYEVAAAAEVLTAAGEVVQARSLVDRYFASNRRPGEIVCRWLRVFLDRMGWTIPLAHCLFARPVDEDHRASIAFPQPAEAEISGPR